MSGRTIAANLVKLNSVIIWKYYVIKPKKILICMFKIISTNIIIVFAIANITYAKH